MADVDDKAGIGDPLDAPAAPDKLADESGAAGTMLRVEMLRGQNKKDRPSTSSQRP